MRANYSQWNAKRMYALRCERDDLDEGEFFLLEPRLFACNLIRKQLCTGEDAGPSVDAV